MKADARGIELRADLTDLGDENLIIHDEKRIQ